MRLVTTLEQGHTCPSDFDKLPPHPPLRLQRPGGDAGGHARPSNERVADLACEWQIQRPCGRSGELVAWIRQAGLSGGSKQCLCAPMDPTTAVAHSAPTKAGSSGGEAGFGGGESRADERRWSVDALGRPIHGFFFSFFFIFIS